MSGARRARSRRRGPGALALLAVASVIAGCAPERDYPAEVHYLDQGWGNADRQNFYYTPQGAELYGVRYAWLRYLELPFSRARFADPRYMQRFGFLYDPAQLLPGYEPPPWNPANLPVGFASHADKDTGEAMVDLNCALCHTGQIEYGGKAIRIDGGPAMHAVSSTRTSNFVTTLILSVTLTYADPYKFDRFARNVLGVDYPRRKAELHEEMAAVVARLSVEAYHILRGGLFPVDEGYGRIDALNHIGHNTFGNELDPANFREGDAPESYPHLWDIWKFDWVQWTGFSAQPMARNIGEVLNLAKLDLVDDYGRPLPPDSMYRTSALVPELDCLETTLWKLQAPIWDERLLPPIDTLKVGKGRVLFDSLCVHCHGPHYFPTREAQATPGKPVEWQMVVVPQQEVGTDSRVLDDFLGYRYDASALDPGNPALKEVDAQTALDYVTRKVLGRIYGEMQLDSVQRYYLDGFGRPIGTRVLRGYKSRPLHGVWATGPFLHNGSVPTLYEMLLPEERRTKVFWTGSRRFDPVKVGIVATDSVGGFRFDTSIPGNQNTGHQFRDDGGAGVIGPGLSDDERYAIIEYLKVFGSRPEDYGTRPGCTSAQRDTCAPGYSSTALYPPTCKASLQGPPAYADSASRLGPSAVGRGRTADLPTALAWRAWADTMRARAIRSGSDTTAAAAFRVLADSLVVRTRQGRLSP